MTSERRADRRVRAVLLGVLCAPWVGGVLALAIGQGGEPAPVRVTGVTPVADFAGGEGPPISHPR